MKLNANQKQFFDSIKGYGIAVDSGTWRSGKSFELCLFLILRMRKYPGIRQFIGRKTLKSLKETTFLKFQEVLNDHFYLVENRDFWVKRSSSPEVIFPNGSTCIFGDLDINTIGKWLSAEYSDIAIDEGQEINQLAFEKIKSRQTQTIIQKLSNGTQKNKFLIAMNPPETADQHWSHGRFRDPNTKIKDSVMVYSHIENNRENIPEGYIEDMLDAVDSRTAEIYLKGNWTPLLSMLVYNEYDFPQDKQGNYIEGGNIRFMEVNPGYENYFFMDFGWTHPMSIGCWQYNREEGEFYRLYEFVDSHVKPEKYCEFLMGNEILHNNKRYKSPFSVDNAILVVGIESKQSRQEADGMSNLTLMRAAFSKYGKHPSIRISGPGLQESIISVRRHVCNALGRRKIFIDPRYCQRFIMDVRAYHYPVDAAGNIVSEEPQKDGICDNTQDEARYGIHFIAPIISNKLLIQKR